MRFYRRRLPHRDIPGAATFVTWCLDGSLPAERAFRRDQLTTGQAFAAWDGLLDRCPTGSKFLAMPDIADLVKRRILRAETENLCALDSYVVMPNHVHVLWAPRVSLVELVRRVKGSTAVEANRILGRTGTRFWQDEYFDRTARTDADTVRMRNYIENNPVKAGLVAAPELYPWSSAFQRG